jgi:hypothetical protein
MSELVNNNISESEEGLNKNLLDIEFQFRMLKYVKKNINSNIKYIPIIVNEKNIEIPEIWFDDTFIFESNSREDKLKEALKKWINEIEEEFNKNPSKNCLIIQIRHENFCLTGSFTLLECENNFIILPEKGYIVQNQIEKIYYNELINQ